MVFLGVIQKGKDGAGLKLAIQTDLFDLAPAGFGHEGNVVESAAKAVVNDEGLPFGRKTGNKTQVVHLEF